MTNRMLCELIQRTLAGGTASDDFEPKIEEIFRWLGPGIAYAAKVAYSDSVNIDGIEFVGDAFYTTFKNLALTKDEDTGWYTTTLPATPYGLSIGHDITNVALQGVGKVGLPALRVSQTQRAFFERLPMPENRLFYWVEGDELSIKTFGVLDGDTVRVTMASTSSTSLDGPAGCPEDYIPGIVDFIRKQYLPTLNLPKDLSNDGVNVR